MTILVADVHDFTQLTSGLSPEETLAWLNRCFSLLGPCIRQHGGFVHRYVEDALIALFPGDPREAVLAAADMQQSLSTQQHADGTDRPIRIGVGIHTGTVLMGTVGEEARLETTAISEAIDQAIHVEALTRTLGCDVLFTESVELHLQQEERDRARWLGRFPFVRASRAIAIHEFFAHEEAATIARKQDSRGTMERAVGMERLRTGACKSRYPGGARHRTCQRTPPSHLNHS